MKTRLWSFWFLALAALACSSPAFTPNAKPAPPTSVTPEEPRDSGGLGWLTARDPRGETGAVELAGVLVKAHQVGDYAALDIDHVFRSRSDVQLEGTFRFPLPEGALLTGLAMLIDGKLVEGELVEREKARQVYQEIVDSMQDPALLEWEHGTTFKMRVFPILPGEQKHVTVRYLAPLRKKSNGWVFAQSTRRGTLSDPLPELIIDWQGKRVFQERNVAPGRVLESPASEPSPILREQRGDGVYTALRVRPDWSRVPVETRARPRHFLFALDTSRSSLEEQKLSLESLRAALGALSPDQKFLVLTHDIDVRFDPHGFSPARPDTIEAALAFAQQTPADGATDLGTLFEAAGRALKGVNDATVVSIGDSEPTWGTLETPALLALAKQALGSISLNPIVIGTATDPELARQLAQATGGRTLRAEHPGDIAVFVKRLGAPSPRLPEVMVSAAAGAEVFPSGKLALEAGEDLLLLVKTPLGKEALDQLTVKAKIGGREQSLLERRPSAETAFVAKRFGAELIQSLEHESKPPAEVVAASLNYGVMSKYTSFLVLESEEAYARYAIERKAAREAQAPRVTGADLASLDGDGASVSLNRIQPGDPEITIEASSDCESVSVVFPFGETKRARFDPEASHGHGAWIVRFLVDRDTPEGSYEVLAYIVHRDGRREVRKLSYTVDRTAPVLNARVRPAPGRPGFLEVSVNQRAPEDQRDLRRVEMRLPDGRTQPLTAIRWAEFRGTVRTPARGSTLRLAGFDQALNHTTLEVALDGRPRARVEPVNIAGGETAIDTLPGSAHVHLSGPATPESVTLSGLPTADVSALARGRGRLFIGSFDEGLFVARAGKLNRVESGVNPNVNALAWDESAGVLWVATARGLSRCELASGGELACHREGQSVAVHALLLARDGSVIAGTERGLLVRTGTEEREFGAKQRAPFRAVWSLAESAAGELYVGTTSGVYWAKTAAFAGAARGVTPRLARAALVSGELSDDWVTALSVEGEELHVGTYNAGLASFRITASGIAPSARDESLGYVNPAGLALLGDGRLAVATMDGLRLGTSGNFTTVKTLGRDVTALVPADANGDYWVGTRRGVERKRLDESASSEGSRSLRRAP